MEIEALRWSMWANRHFRRDKGSSWGVDCKPRGKTPEGGLLGADGADPCERAFDPFVRMPSIPCAQHVVVAAVDACIDSCGASEPCGETAESSAANSATSEASEGVDDPCFVDSAIAEEGKEDFDR